ncbi:CDP-glycerol glycerophosphotransferase family protein, partial [Klebsiella pneumoniae]|uniref:CDP-glycerol glycerophosphotransferase family protein n=1 Tax=Klebsiella pneumoniae TaxID=573 RepID=UPI0034D1E279
MLRPHPHSVGAYDGGPASSPRIRMLTAAAQNDVTPVLPAIDLLITDYSSIAYDFALTGRPIAYLAPDVERYVATRGL